VSVYKALKEKGYNPINQIVGYILSGDPTYITNHLDARSSIRKVERDELLEEILRCYLKSVSAKKAPYNYYTEFFIIFQFISIIRYKSC